jgi:hypothetical protein
MCKYMYIYIYVRVHTYGGDGIAALQWCTAESVAMDCAINCGHRM